MLFLTWSGQFDTRGQVKPLCLLWLFVKFMLLFAVYYVVRNAVPTALYLKHSPGRNPVGPTPCIVSL